MVRTTINNNLHCSTKNSHLCNNLVLYVVFIKLATKKQKWETVNVSEKCGVVTADYTL